VTWDFHGVADEHFSSWISSQVHLWFSTNSSDELPASIIRAVKEDKLLGELIVLYTGTAD
jgi:hypothetical protein